MTHHSCFSLPLSASIAPLLLVVPPPPESPADQISSMSSLLQGETTDAGGCTAYRRPCWTRHSFTEVPVPDTWSGHGSFAEASLYEINPNQFRRNPLPLPTDNGEDGVRRESHHHGGPRGPPRGPRVQLHRLHEGASHADLCTVSTTSPFGAATRDSRSSRYLRGLRRAVVRGTLFKIDAGGPNSSS